MCRHPGYSTSHYFWAALDWCSQQPSPCTTCFMLHGLHGYCIAGCTEYFGDPCFEGRYSGVHLVFCFGNCYQLFLFDFSLAGIRLCTAQMPKVVK